MSTFNYNQEMKKKPFYVRLESNDIEELTKVGKTYGMEAAAYSAVILSRFADLKPEFAMHALTSIPKEFFRAGPGRPTTTPASSQANAQKVA